jgi:hypothetical protein
MIGLSGKYAVTLYMLLESVANRQTPVLDVELFQLREWLKVPDGKLEKWYDIKRFILEPALKQINDNPDAAGFSVVMDAIKDSRAVDRVRFVLTKSDSRLIDEKRVQHIEPPKKQAGQSIGGLSLPPSAIEQGRKVAPGWDIYTLERQWREWMADKPKPKTAAGSFVGFCKEKGKQNP